jgi:arginyl-tRNA synthetase
MTSLAKILSERVGAVFEGQGLPADLGAVRVSDRPDLCQFQCNGAMPAAKKVGKNPRELAGAIVEALKNDADIAKVEFAGPGFINIDLTEAAIADFTALQARDERFGAQAYPKDTIILDYGGPNIAKPMHVGHLRASIIGDSLRRIYLFAGYQALGDVHMGDWGTPMGQIISELEIRGILDKPLSMDDLKEIYPIASKACKEDEARMGRARAATAKLQDGDPVYRKVWQQFIDVSIAGMKANFDALGVHFDLWKGEASVHDLIAPMVEALKAKGLAQEDDGAVVVPVALDGDSKEIPPLILYKRDGAVMYGTTDLATILDRMREYLPAPVKMIYVVDQRQSLHFEQVFRAARLGGIAPAEAVELIHAGFGTMNGTDGKPFKTRAGGVMKLEDLIANGVEKARQRLDEANLSAEIGVEEREDIAHKVAIAAIKFADLQNNRIADYVFDLDRMTSFEGKTGPYLLYQAVRIKSLLRKAEAQGVGLSEALKSGQSESGAATKIIIQEADRALALMMAEFPDHFDLALRNNTPHVLCDYAYRLAQAFSSFYSNCHILSEPDAAIRTSRLRLCDMTARQLELVLNLLGIAVPERM